LLDGIAACSVLQYPDWLHGCPQALQAQNSHFVLRERSGRSTVLIVIYPGCDECPRQTAICKHVQWRSASMSNGQTAVNGINGSWFTMIGMLTLRVSE